MITRRNMLSGLGGIAMAPTFLQSVAAQEAAANGTILVCVMLAGGNDGLNTVVPLTQYGHYAKLRTPAKPPNGLALAYAEADLAANAFDGNWHTPASKATEYAFAPSMTAMRALYATGSLAVIAGIGLPKAEENPLSHQNGSTDWLTGKINVTGQPPPGWLGLTLDNATVGKLGATASMGGSSPLVNGAKAQGLVLDPPIDNFGVNYGATDDYDALAKAYRRIGVLPAGSPVAAFDQAQMQAATGDIDTVRHDAHRVQAKDYKVPTWLDYQLRDVARLIVAGSGIRGFYVVQGGYDTHSAQALSQPALLAGLGNSLTRFYAYLQAKSASANVIVMTMSDFGRRPAANLDFGTDHGGATTSFVLGDSVKGGVYGVYPSLTRFDENGNLKLNVDFRNVLSDLIHAMGGNPTPILGQSWPRLGFT